MTDVQETRSRPGVTRRVMVAVGAALAIVAVGIRLVGLTLPPLAFSGHRQVTDALMARGYWLHMGGQLPAGLPEGYSAWVPRALEPPVLQGLASVTYVVAGREELWIPRALLVVAWVATAIAVWGLLDRLIDRTAAAVAVGLWLFSPYAVVFSRSFQPDVPMLCLVVWALWALVREAELRSRRAWWLAGGLAAAAVFVKPTAAFAVVPAMLALVWFDGGPKALWSLRFVRRLAAVLAPTLAYWVLLTVTGHLGGQEQGRTDLAALATLDFWRSWTEMAGRVVPLPLVAVALVGLVVAPRRARLLGVAMLGGYFVHGLALSTHTPIDDYYHVFLIPPVLIGLGAAVTATWAALRRHDFDPVVAGGGLVVLLAVLALSGPRPYPYVETALPASLQVVPGQAEAAGAALDHTEPVLLVSRGYGIAQQYYGWIKGPFWPLEADLKGDPGDGSESSAAERLAGMEQPDYLSLWGVRSGPIDWVLVTEPLIVQQQPALAALLATDFEIAGSGPGWTAWHRR